MLFIYFKAIRFKVNFKEKSWVVAFMGAEATGCNVEVQRPGNTSKGVIISQFLPSVIIYLFVCEQGS